MGFCPFSGSVCFSLFHSVSLSLSLSLSLSSGRPWDSCLPALWSSFQERCSPQKPSSNLSTPTRCSNVSLPCQFCQRLLNRPCEVSKHQLSYPSRQASAADSIQAEKNLLALFATGVSNARVSLVVTCSFAKAPAAALRLSRLMTAPLSPAHPGQMPLSGMKAKCIALLIKLVRHPRQHPPVQPAHYTSTVLEARRLSSLAPLSVKMRLPDLVSGSMSPFGFLPLVVRATGQTPAALDAVIEQVCSGLRSSPPEQALRQLCAVINNFFSQPLPPHRSGTTRQPTSNSTTLRTLRKKLRDLRREWRQRSGEPVAQTVNLHHDFHQTHKQINRITRQHSAFTEARRQAKEHMDFRKDPGDTSMAEKYLTQRVQPRRRFLWNKLKCFLKPVCR